MIRFILRQQYVDTNLGQDSVYHFTLDADVPELERLLRAGGRSETSFKETTIVGVEILQEGI